MESFHWLDGATVTVSATGASSDNPLLKVPTGRFQLRFYNAGTVTVFVKKGAGGVAAVATTADLPIAPGATEVFTVNNNPSAPITSIGAITAGTAATLYVTSGAGI
jgi:FtsP/CotA-like multicopper oxidase with cupredoxin domain